MVRIRIRVRTRIGVRIRIRVRTMLGGAGFTVRERVRVRARVCDRGAVRVAETDDAVRERIARRAVRQVLLALGKPVSIT